MVNSFSDGETGKLVESQKYFAKLVESQKYFAKLVESQKGFPAKTFHSFKLIFKNIVAVRFFLAHYFHRNFLNIMPRHEPVGVIRQTFNSGSGADDGLEFIRCIGGR